MPLRPAIRPSHTSAAVLPIPQSAPRPVATTRRCSMCNFPCGALLILLMLLDVVRCVFDGLDLLRVLIRNLDVEGLFELHHQFDDVERIGAKVFLEACTGRDLSFIYLKLLDDNLFHLLIYCCHCSNLLMDSF